MLGALAARFGRSDEQLAEVLNADALRFAAAALSAVSAPSLEDTRRVVAAALVRIYAAAAEEPPHLGALWKGLSALQVLVHTRKAEGASPGSCCAGLRAALLEGAPELLGGVIVHLETRAMEEEAVEEACEGVMHTVGLLLRSLRDHGSKAGCTGGAATLADAVRQFASTGALAALARFVARVDDGSKFEPVFVLQAALRALKHSGATPASLPPAVVAALEDEAFLARLPVLVGGWYQPANTMAAADLVAAVAWASPRAAASLTHPGRHPSLVALLLAAVDGGWAPVFALPRAAAADALGALASGGGAQHAVRLLTHLPWAFEAFARALLAAECDADVRVMLQGLLPFAREPPLRAQVAANPELLHIIAYEAAGPTERCRTGGAWQLLLMLLTCGDQEMALLVLGVLHAAKHGATVLAEMQTQDADVVALTAAPGAARRAAAALAASERRAARGRTGVFAEEARNSVAVKLFNNATPAEWDALCHDEPWRAAMRRASMLLVLGLSVKDLLDAGAPRFAAAKFAEMARLVAGGDAARDASGECDTPGVQEVLASAGLFAALRGPEMVFVVRQNAALGIAPALLCALLQLATPRFVEQMEMRRRRQGGAAAACAELLEMGMALRDSDLGALDEYIKELLGDAPGTQGLVAAAADDGAEVVWRFIRPPPGSAERALVDDQFGTRDTRINASTKLAMSTALADEGDSVAEEPLPALLCDVSACLEPLLAAAARRPGGPAAALRDALLAAYAAAQKKEAEEANDLLVAPDSEPPASFEDCQTCRAARRTGAKCARLRCGATQTPEHRTLKRCARCLTAAYCTPACQKLDWKRHRREDCVPTDEQ